MDKILMGKGENQVFLLPKMMNRHGLISGATGERVIIVTGFINALATRVSETFKQN